MLILTSKTFIVKSLQVVSPLRGVWEDVVAWKLTQPLNFHVEGEISYNVVKTITEEFGEVR